MSIDYNGSFAWTNEYPISGYARAITLNSFSGDLAIVGVTTLSGSRDGLFIELSASTGGINIFNSYDYGGYLQEFFSIYQTQNPGLGYVIGGTCEQSPGLYRLYNINLTLGGVINWDNAFCLNSDKTASQLLGIVERQNTVPAYEYYGVTTTSVGIVAVKFNNNGVPIFPSAFDEFIINSSGTNLTALSIHTLEGLGYDDGLHIFGTDNNSGLPVNILSNAYFNGYDGCNSLGSHFTNGTGLCSANAQAISPSAGILPCNAAAITEQVGGSDASICGPYSSVTGGSNAKATSILEKTKVSSEITVFPNPANDIVSIKSNKGSIQNFEIFDVTGKSCFKQEVSVQTNLVKLDISSTKLSAGVYHISVKAENGELNTLLTVIPSK